MNRPRSCSVFFVCFLSASALFAWNPFAPKISFERRTPAPHNLGPAKKLVLLEARGHGEPFDKYLSALFAWAKDDTIELVDGRSANVRVAELAGNAEKVKELASRWPDADGFLGADLRGCNSQQQSGTTTEKQKDGSKRTVTEYWVTADCNADFRIVDAATARLVADGQTSGKDESSRSKTLYSFTTDGTINGAAADTARNTYRSFAPRKQKQTLVLDKSAPSFKEGMNRINANDYAGARAVWEAALASNPGSAALHLDVAEVNEALGNHEAAKQHYEEALRLDPSDANKRWVAEFQTREQQDAALAKKP